jgi:hypothetical protein
LCSSTLKGGVLLPFARVAGYHQFHAVRHAVQRTLAATRPEGDRKVGVVWHTQGLGKSLLVAFYAGQVIKHPDKANPTLVVLTDRNDLDDQLFGTFAMCKDLLRQTPQQPKTERSYASCSIGPLAASSSHQFGNSRRRRGGRIIRCSTTGAMWG